MSFGTTLKYIMEESGLKAVDFVDDVLTPRYMSQLLNNKMKSPTWERGVYIVDKLGMSIDEFWALEKKLDQK